MVQYKDVRDGYKARRKVNFPGSILGGAAEVEYVLDLALLDGDQDGEAMRGARNFARSKGVDAPKDGEPEYDLGYMAHTLLYGCVDHDSPREVPAPFFSSVEQILRHLDRERIVWLYGLHQAFAKELSPATKPADFDEVLSVVAEVAGMGDEEDSLDFLEKYGPAKLYRCVLFLARLHVTSLTLKSLSGSLGSASTKSGKSETRSRS